MKLATSPLKGKPRRQSRVDREERLVFVRRLLTDRSIIRAVFVFYEMYNFHFYCYLFFFTS